MCLNLLGVSTSTVVKPFERGPKVSTFWGSLESDTLFLSQIVVKTVVKSPQLLTTIIDFLERLYGNRVQFVWSGERGSNPRPQLWESCARVQSPPDTSNFDLKSGPGVVSRPEFFGGSAAWNHAASAVSRW